ncbi:MAG: Lsr2 family protein [Bifidobacteriaceae bacterium]|jgi:hypothetical protein|nr:Lsr2 family protein [Bifidobacteriaceae bacterium]
MVQRIQYLIFDDLDGAEAAETVAFALDGVKYEVDLTAEHAAELRQGLTRWIEAARRVKPRAGSRQSAKAAAETVKVRAWAREQGMDVSDRGRIPVEIRDAYRAAH